MTTRGTPSERAPRPGKGWGHWAQVLGAHAVLLGYTAFALFPILLVVVNSFKERRAIFRTPYALPDADTFSLVGYRTVFTGARFDLYFVNSLIVTLGSLALVLLFASMAAHALAEYRFRGNTLLGLYLAIGIMIPIRLGTVSILRMMVALGLTDTLWSLILVYTAQGIPLAVFILSVFMRQVPGELKDAARIDGASEFGIFSRIVMPLTRHNVAALAIIVFIFKYDDLIWPLVVAQRTEMYPVTVGLVEYVGQFFVEYHLYTTASVLVMLPIFVLYLFLQRYIIEGIATQGLKG